MALFAAAAAITGCGYFGDDAPPPSLFPLVFENATGQPSVTVEGTSTSGEVVTERIGADPPVERAAPSFGCLSDLTATASDGSAYDLAELCPGDVWQIGGDVIRRPARDEILDWCDRLDAEGAVPGVLEAFARHGFSERDDFSAALNDSTRLAEAEAELGEACQDVRRDQAWEYETSFG
ncbi:MAG: hypothetical protein H0W25_08895 [Acidimicrobiia bacterium]|nr:hypothetical protein [Acidimicrobiia bacterium]